MSKFAFVILHYNTVDDTQACVASIQEKCACFDYHIYVVDNKSPNDSGKTIVSLYENCSNVSVILSDENLGFARGNNLGVSEALRDGYSDFVVVLNSDTKILQENFCDLLKSNYEQFKYAVLGPTIITPAGKTFINPGRKYILEGEELNQKERMYKRKRMLLRLHLNWMLDFYKKVHLRLKPISPPAEAFKRTEQCLLHGCCLVFSSVFFSKFKGFDNRTFLYFEEEILFAHVVKTGLKSIYVPEIEIWHKEDGSTDSILSQPSKKKMFLVSNILRSIQIYREVLNEYGTFEA